MNGPLYALGYRDAFTGQRAHEQLRFTWGYRMGWKVGLAMRERRDEAVAA